MYSIVFATSSFFFSYLMCFELLNDACLSEQVCKSETDPLPASSLPSLLRPVDPASSLPLFTWPHSRMCWIQENWNEEDPSELEFFTMMLLELLRPPEWNVHLRGASCWQSSDRISQRCKTQWFCLFFHGSPLPLVSLSGLPWSLLGALPLNGRASSSCSVRKAWVQIPALPQSKQFPWLWTSNKLF